MGGDPGNQYLESNLFDVCSHSTVEEVSERKHDNCINDDFISVRLVQRRLRSTGAWALWVMWLRLGSAVMCQTVTKTPGETQWKYEILMNIQR